MIYEWRPGSHIRIDAQKAGEALERIRRKNAGMLEPATVLASAMSPRSALHEHFEWDDQKAAHAHRIEQAGHLIRCVSVVVDKPTGGEGPVRAFVNVKRDTERGYTSVQDALQDPDLRAQVVASAFAEVVAWRKRHAELVELARVFSAIDFEARAA